MAFIRANGIVMHYALYGKSEAPRLVFVNSLGTDFHIWDGVTAGLKQDYEILVYDMRGHGLSEGREETFTISLLADDLAALLDAVGWHDGVTLVGLSVGGLVTLQSALKWPQRLSRIVLMDTAAKIGTDESWNARIDAVKKQGVAAISDMILKNWFTDRFAAASPVDFAGFRMMLERTPARAYAATCAALRDADLTRGIEKIRLPALGIAGDGDRSTPPELVRSTVQLIAGAQFELIEGAGHLPCIEQPDKVIALVSAFMEGRFHV